MIFLCMQRRVRRSTLSALAVCLLFSTISCKKKAAYFAITDQRLRDALTYRTGTYFVYEDSASGRIDSFYLLREEQHDARKLNSNDDVVAEFERREYRFTDYPRYPKTFEFSLFCGGDTLLMDKILFQFDPRYGLQAVCMKIPFKAGDTVNRFGYRSELTAHHSRMSIAGTAYHDVYEVYTSALDRTAVRTFFAPSGGMLRFERYDTGASSEIWNLKRSRIVR